MGTRVTWVEGGGTVCLHFHSRVTWVGGGGTVCSHFWCVRSTVLQVLGPGLFIIFLTPPRTHSPAEMFVNRLEVDFIDVNNSVKLDANHMVVVYKQEEGKIDRRIVQGPTIFVPNAHEW